MSQGYDLIGDVGGCTFSSSTGDLTNIDPKLGKLIGWPGYQPLLAGSPAINAGNPGGCVGSAGPLATDERGAGRVGRCDIGAYEYTAAGPASQIVAYAGTPQSAAPTAAFRTPFQALVLDPSGSPVSNASVLFTAPQNGASGVFTGTSWLTATAATNDSGIAVSPAFTANSTPGAYVISATVSGIITPALLAVTNIAWYVTPTGTDLNSCQTPATPCGTIGGAVEKAGAGDTVEVAVGIYTTSSGAQVVLIDRDLFLLGGWNKLFTLQGGMSTMDGSGVRQVMVVQGGVAAQAEDFIIQHGLPSSTQAAGLINYGVLDLTNAVISKNPPGEGIANFGVLNVSQSLISDNTSGVVNWGLLALNDSTISGNPGSGVANGGIAWLSNDTISGNAVVGGSGFFDLGNGARATLQNTIVAGNAPTTTGDCWGTFVSGGYNLIGDHTQNCTFAAAAGDQLNQQPLLGPLQDNGGRNLSQAPLAGSPAINAGNPAGCVNNLGSPIAVDQRGYPRFGRCDIGAVEIQPLDLSEKTVDHDTQLPGQAVRYTVRLKNGGGSSLPGVAVTDTLPAGLKYITGTLAASGGSAGYVSGVITWTGTVEAGATTTIQFSAASLPNASLGTVLTNTAVIRGGGEEFTRQASLTLGLAKIYLPLNFKPLPGIQGYVTVNGVPTGGVFLELRRFDGNAYSTQLSLYTDSNGYYNFNSAPSLPSGQFYYVRYLNTNNTLGWLSYWATAQISSYAAGSALGMGSFDLADIPLAAPDPGVTVSLPTSFQWVRRPATPTDSYQLSLFDPQGSAFDQSTLLGYVSGVTVTGLSNSFSAGRPYGWYVAVNSPDGGYGESFYYRRITFNNTNTAAENRADVVSGAALSAATRPVDRPPR
jgi:uncharacterized repeat protein (TIGR01451 family)